MFLVLGGFYVVNSIVLLLHGYRNSSTSYRNHPVSYKTASSRTAALATGTTPFSYRRAPSAAGIDLSAYRNSRFTYRNSSVC
jgi:hypothetical protein